MATNRSAADFIPQYRTLTLPVLRDAAADCQGCDLYKSGAQTVFGEGPADASIVIVGEQPGDTEDRTGRPFVGRAGELLDEVLHRVGLHRRELYITNVVKHFRFRQENGRRTSIKATVRQVRACRPWLEKELALIRPQTLVCVGSLAAKTLIDQDFRISRQRGEVHETPWAAWAIATIHPAALLRIPDASQRHVAVEQFVQDMSQVAARQRRVA